MQSLIICLDASLSRWDNHICKNIHVNYDIVHMGPCFFLKSYTQPQSDKPLCLSVNAHSLDDLHHPRTSIALKVVQIRA